MGIQNNIVDCDGACLNDADGDDVCDENEVAGCTDEAACNYERFCYRRQWFLSLPD